MTYNVRPTPRMVATVKNLTDSEGKPRSMRAAMLAAGYSKDSADNPKRLTNSQAFKTLLVQMGVTQEKLVEVLEGGLNATTLQVKLEGKDEKGKPLQISIESPDWNIRHKFLELALKVWGLPATEPADGPGQKANTINNFIDARQQQKNDYNL